MRLHALNVLAYALLSVALPGTAHPYQQKYDLQKFHIDLDSRRMVDLIRQTRLPKKPEYPDLGATAGIDLDVLKSMQKQWVTSFDWPKEQASLNGFNHFTAHIEGLRIHFIHEKASDPDAIPLILCHGWPGSFLEFEPIIKSLAAQAQTSTNKSISFNVVVPSLPGLAFSTAPPANWTIDDTARVYHTLMTKVLGYKTFAVFGTDWGCGPSFGLYRDYTASTRAAHFAFIPFLPATSEELKSDNITLNSLEAFEEATSEAWLTTGAAYFAEHSTKPNTIGLALYDNPVGQLAWIDSDPRAGTGPSLLTHDAILRSVSLYYLTESFVSSIFLYYQNLLDGLHPVYAKAQTDAPMLFSAFKYNIAFWHKEKVATVGNLVQYRNHDFGGHFPGIDNPPALLEDLREIGNFWEG
ncbi:hypothetical protein LTR97_009702 [Elasticomyces elasticus]|uniref:Epoxide hydrolase N-terminal domain-containing protein n=1 Tax=Elasticomyces elasticus TaxID=574655 RepID=A0AAN7ZRT3_9PEZI|nr:hypothetical protein LTR97_009702 [Elasticomyces elasticus]